jgi:hypothetical protein
VIAASNWPVVLIEFALESFYKLTLSVPVVGGALMVGALVGTDMGSFMDQGVRSAADQVVASLGSAPMALTSFLASLSVLAFGGEAILFVLKAGTLAVLVEGERRSKAMPDVPVDSEGLRRVRAYSLQLVYDATRHFGRRAFVLSLGLGVAYLVIGLTYLVVLNFSFALAGQTAWMSWPVVVLVATAVAVLTIAAVNLAYDLLRVILVTDDCSVRDAAFRLRLFVIEDARQVMGIFAVIAGVVFVATVAALLAAGGLAFVAVVPYVSLIVLPLQATVWLMRGIVFQYMSIGALSAYQTQYRRFSDWRWEPGAGHRLRQP